MRKSTTKKAAQKKTVIIQLKREYNLITNLQGEMGLINRRVGCADADESTKSDAV